MTVTKNFIQRPTVLVLLALVVLGLLFFSFSSSTPDQSKFSDLKPYPVKINSNLNKQTDKQEAVESSSSKDVKQNKNMPKIPNDSLRERWQDFIKNNHAQDIVQENQRLFHDYQIAIKEFTLSEDYCAPKDSIDMEWIERAKARFGSDFKSLKGELRLAIFNLGREKEAYCKQEVRAALLDVELKLQDSIRKLNTLNRKFLKTLTNKDDRSLFITFIDAYKGYEKDEGPMHMVLGEALDLVNPDQVSNRVLDFVESDPAFQGYFNGFHAAEVLFD